MSAASITAGPKLSAAVALLSSAGLPTGDLTQQHCDSFFYMGPEAAPEGLVGLELLGDVALLRSLVVADGLRGSGAGARLLAHAESHARARGVKTLYLLTTTAERFFPKLGFEPISRADVPESIQASVEFQSACPRSATVMRKRMAPVR